jgi:hypothetical protein
MSESTRHQAKASITVSVWNPVPYQEPAAGPSLVRIDVEESFAGDLEGTGVATMLQVLRPDGSATFCALERVTGTLAGRAGTFVLQDAGELAADGRVAGTWFVVPGSGTGELNGLCGDGGFDAQLGAHASAVLNYWFAG